MGVRLSSTFDNINGDRFTIEIHDSDYALTATEFTVGGDGFTLSWDGSTDDLLDPIIGSTLEFTFIEESNTHNSALDLLATAEEGRFTVQVKKGTDRYWVGVILPEQVSRPDEPYPRPTTITATCDLGNLKNIDFNDDGASYTGKEDLNDILIKALNKTRVTDFFSTSILDVFVRVANGIYATNANTTELLMHRIDQSLFRNPDDNGTPRYFDTYEVLRSLAVTFNARVFQADGNYWFVPVSQYQSTPGQLVAKGYRKTGGIAAVGATITNNVNQGPTFERIAGGRQTHIAALKKVSRHMDTLAVHPIVADQDLDPYDSTTLTDDGRVYQEGQRLVVGGKFVYSWPEGHSGSVPANLFDRIAALELRFTIKVGAKYLTRTATYNSAQTFSNTGNDILDFFLPEYGPDTFGTSAGYWPVVWGEFANLYDSPSISDSFTFEFEVPEDLTGLELSVDVVGRDDQGNLFAAAIDGDGTTAPVIQFLDMAVYYGGDQIPGKVEFRSTSDKNSRHSIDQGTVLFGDTIGDVTLGELEAYNGTDWVTPDGYDVDGLEGAAFNTYTTTFIHKLGVDEVLRMRIDPVKVLEATWRGSDDFHMYNTVFYSSTYYLPLTHQFIAQRGEHQLTVFKVARSNVADVSEPADVDVTFNDNPRNGKGPAGKPRPLLDGDRLRDLRGEGVVNSDLSDVQADVETNTTAISTIESDVSTLQGDVATANIDISSNSGNITTLDTGLNGLQKKIEGENLDKLGVFSVVTDDTQGSVKVTTTSAILRAGDKTAVEATQTSPGLLAFKVQAGASGSEAEVTAAQISGSASVNTKATINFTSGDCRFTNTPVQFNSGSAVTFQGASTFNGSTSGVDYADLDNKPTIPADLTDLGDTPASLGTAGQVLAVNTGATALEFVDQSGGGASAKVYTFHDAGRRQFSGSQDNYYHVGDSIYGLSDNAKNYALSSYTTGSVVSYLIDDFHINSFVVPADCTSAAIRGSFHTTSSALTEKDVDVYVYKLVPNNTSSANRHTATQILNVSVEMPESTRRVIQWSASASSLSLSAGDYLHVVFKPSGVATTSTHYLYYSHTLTITE